MKLVIGLMVLAITNKLAAFGRQDLVHTDNGVTCSDSGFIDLSTAQECSVAVSYAKSFNRKANYLSTTNNSERHKGCFIFDSGAMWFNMHNTGSRSSYDTSICRKGNTQF